MAQLQQSNFELLSVHTDWRATWSHIVAGQFTAGLYSSLLFYEQSTGHAEFYETDGQGGMSPLNHHDDWRKSWSIVVPGYFRNSSFLPQDRQPANSGLLLYDRQAGFGAIYDTNGHGVIEKLAEYTGWRTTWTHIIAGVFTKMPHSSLLFYDQASGYAELYATDGAGGMGTGPFKSYNWAKGWTHIIPGEFWNDGSTSEPVATDLFLYDATRRFGITFANDGLGNFAPVSQGFSLGPSGGTVTLPEQIGPPPGRMNLPPATSILPGSFGANEWTNLLFYDANTGTGRFMALSYAGDPPQGLWSVSEEYTDWRTSWNIIVTGNFWTADPNDFRFPEGAFTDLMFYEAADGYGEFYLHEPPNPVIAPLAGYASMRSARGGDTISFFVASQVGPYQIRIFRQGLEEVAMADLQVTPADPLPISRLAYRDGAGWPAVASLTIPREWPSGLYFARAYVPAPTNRPPFGGGMLTVERALQQQVSPLDIPFVVRAANPGQGARILLAISDTTYEAYNFWGGRSLYGYAHGGDYAWAYPQTAFRIPYSFRVSFLRPHASAGSQANKWKNYEVPLIQWIERQAIDVEYCVASDLNKSDALGLIDRYKLIVIVGHSEYWSKAMKDNLQAFISKGGNAAFLGGNICYWQIRFDDDPVTGPGMVCFKQADFDPYNGGNESERDRTSVLWSTFDDSDYKLTGVSYGWAHYPDIPQFQVCEPSHWLFANTGLELHDSFGRYGNDGATIAGPETDRRVHGKTPDNFLLLAIDRDIDGTEVGSMGVMTNGGTVVTFAATEWAQGLSQDGSWNAMDLITRNLLIRLG